MWKRRNVLRYSVTARLHLRILACNYVPSVGPQGGIPSAASANRPSQPRMPAIPHSMASKRRKNSTISSPLASWTPRPEKGKKGPTQSQHGTLISRLICPTPSPASHVPPPAHLVPRHASTRSGTSIVGRGTARRDSCAPALGRTWWAELADARSGLVRAPAQARRCGWPGG